MFLILISIALMRPGWTRVCIDPVDKHSKLGLEAYTMEVRNNWLKDGAVQTQGSDVSQLILAPDGSKLLAYVVSDPSFSLKTVQDPTYAAWRKKHPDLYYSVHSPSADGVFIVLLKNRPSTERRRRTICGTLWLKKHRVMFLTYYSTGVSDKKEESSMISTMLASVTPIGN